MMKNCISLNSRRKQIEKINVQKDQQGNHVLSKVARVKPDVKSLASARSYMLKMLVEKVFTKKQISGKGKRANVYATLLRQKDKYNGIEQGQQTTANEDLETYQHIFVQAASYFQEEYGDLKNIPAFIIASRFYRDATPENIIRNLLVLGIDKTQFKFYWLARLMDCLQLPPKWSKSKGKTQQIYTYEPLKMKFDIHPSYIYMINQMNTFKSEFQEYPDEQKYEYYKYRQMEFFDFFERMYKVDIYGLIKEQQRKAYAKYSDKAQKGKLKGQNKLALKMNQQLVNCDWMALEGILNSEIKTQAFALIGNIVNFWKSKYFYDEQWIPCVSPFGEVVWSSTVNFSCNDQCPYRQTLVELIEEQTKNLPLLDVKHFKNNLRKSLKESQTQNGHFEIDQGSSSEIQIKKISQEREKFLGFYLDHIDKSQPYNIEGSYSQKSFYDQIFSCPFSLDEGVENMDFTIDENGVIVSSQTNDNEENDDEEIPLWMEKVRANRFASKIKNLLQFNYEFDELRKQVAKYGLDMVKREEPHRVNQIEEKIRNLKNKQNLLIFLDQVTNVGAREDRKNKLNQFQQEENQNKEFQNDDIFGSEMSNLDPSEVQLSEHSLQQVSAESNQNQSSDEQNEEKNIESSSSESSRQNSDDDQNAGKQQTIEYEQRLDYSFLKDFKQHQFQQSEYFDKIDDQTLDSLLRKKIKQNLKKYKYSKSHIRQAFKTIIQKPKGHEDENCLRNIKRNMIITDLQSKSVPYKDQNIIKFGGKYSAKQFLENLSGYEQDFKNVKNIDRKNLSGFDLVKRPDMFQIYESEMDEYSVQEELENQIQKETQKRIQQRKLKQQQQLKRQRQIEEQIRRAELQRQAKQAAQLQKQFTLQPILRIKPDINKDLRLRHINSIDANNQEVKDFRRTFSSKKFTSTANNSTYSSQFSITPPNPSSQLSSKFKVRAMSVSNFRKVNPEYQQQSAIKNPRRSQPSLTIRFRSLNQGADTYRNKTPNPNSSKNIAFENKVSLYNSNISKSSRQGFANTKQAAGSMHNLVDAKLVFNRVCLNNTATAFLSTQSIKSKTDLIELQAKKSLVHKGRGLGTYVSKKY